MNGLDISRIYLVTGGAGFIGFHLSKSLLEKGAVVIGFDNMNDYYDVKLKEDRLALLEKYESYTFVKGDLSDNADVFRVFQEYRPQIVMNLGAQAGVRYSIDNPRAYMESNMMGFFIFWRHAGIFQWIIWYMLPPVPSMAGMRRCRSLRKTRWMSR